MYDSEYGGNRGNAIILEGVLPEGSEIENNSNIEQASFKIESEDMIFSINEWYENGFSYANWIPEDIDSKHLGNILMHDYSDQFIYYFSNSENYKKSDCTVSYTHLKLVINASRKCSGEIFRRGNYRGFWKSHNQ